MTYEEISEKYPIGKLLARTVELKWRTGYWTTQADKDFYNKNYEYVRFYDNGNVEFKETYLKEYHVQGWIATDEGFFVAENTWDGWQPLDEEDLAEIEARGIMYEF